jgi:trans-aconitate 2-methyltransferase
MEDWSAAQYFRFEAERTRPARDLLARVPESERRRVVDIGCGPGNSTELLGLRFPDAELLGLDSSDDMLAEARARLPRVRFEKADVARWRGEAQYDLIFANAVLQWIPGHVALMVRLTLGLAAGGCLAVQVPDNFDEPSHRLMRAIAARPAFADRLGTAAEAREPIGRFAAYYEALAPHCATIDIWRTTYIHVLSGPDAIVDWVRGTGLRPFLAPLGPPERAAFLAAYIEEIEGAYPRCADGRVLLAFPRLFVVATKAGATTPHG